MDSTVNEVGLKLRFHNSLGVELRRAEHRLLLE